MTRHIVLGNQSLLVNIDGWLQVRDIYFPHVGQENHLLGHSHKTGVFADGRMSWVNEDAWERQPGYLENTLVTHSMAQNSELGISLLFEEDVHCNENVFFRKITVENQRPQDRSVKVFFNHDFHLYGDGIGDTAVYQMDRNVVIHYKRSRYFLIGILKSNLLMGIRGDVDDYTIGSVQEGAKSISYTDAYDGILSKNPVAQGSVDSTIAVHLDLPANSKKTFYYYLVAGFNFSEVYRTHDLLVSRGPENMFLEAGYCQKSWLDKSKSLRGVSPRLTDLFLRSLLVIKTQTDKGGAIIAANDSDNMQFNRDTYSYMWPRDGALVALAMLRAGFPEFARDLFLFCQEAIWEKGCLLHKYNPDGTLGSSWHPWVEYGGVALPIQEDETALVIHALWEYYLHTKDLDFVKQLYPGLVKKAAVFMNEYRHENELPKESYDLWEERRGIFTFTSAAVYAGLVAAEHLGHLFRDETVCMMCHERYEKLKAAILSELYDSEAGVFIRGIRYPGGDITKKVRDITVDSSMYALFEFGLLPADDPRVERTMKLIEERLWVHDGKGGLSRYEHDLYHRKADNTPGNPWIICTLWLAKWHIAKAKEENDLKKALELIDWVAKCSIPTGMMPEQVHPFTGAPLSVAPLTWSHAEFVDTLIKYSDKIKEFNPGI